LKECDIIYGFQIGVILKKRDAEVLVSTETFKKSFVFKGFSEDYVHYLPKEMKVRGPADGSAPVRVAKIKRSNELVVIYPEIEQQMFDVELIHPRGNPSICFENDWKWRTVLNHFFVNIPTMLSINGDRYNCSDCC